MTIKEILKLTEHRPWGLPTDSWKYYQEWNKAVFLHWQVEYAELKKFVPDDLEIDLFEGKPWVSLVAFTMEKIRPRYLPPFSPVSNFDEINIRTYVRYACTYIHKQRYNLLTLYSCLKLLKINRV